MTQSVLEEISERAFAALEAAGGDPNSLPISSQTIVIVYGAQAVIDNGGLEYFFSANFPGDPPFATFVDAYRRIGAVQAAECIEQAVSMFPFQEPHLHEQLRRQYIEGLASEHPFVRLSDKVCGDEAVWDLLSIYAMGHRAEVMAA